MASDVVPHGIKIEWNYVQNNIPVVNRVYTVVAGSPTTTNLEQAIVEAHAFYLDIQGLQHPTLILQNITATDVHVANGTQTVLPLTTSNVGTGTGSAVAANAAVVISLRTNFTGRSFRGRFYAGALCDSNMANAQNIITSAATFYAGAMEDFIDALNTINMTLVVVSRFAAGVARVVNLATEIISVIVDTKIDSQRRRTAN